MGPSGAGKSTLMDILAMRKSTGQLSGSVLLDGQPASRAFISHTSYIPQVSTSHLCSASHLSTHACTTHMLGSPNLVG
jgi:ABC-type multidrug transport system ATPase subunit